MKKISIVSPIFNDEKSLPECYETVRLLFEGPLKGYEREHIFCDNCSTDSTPELLRNLAKKDSHVKVIFNSRNFGILRSTYNGVMAATGDAVLLFLPVDLQDPPELIPDFVKLWESGYEVVFGIRAQRQESFLMRSLRKIYYRVISRFSYVEYPPDVGDFQLVDRKVINAMKQFEDVNPFMRMMTFECGFKSVGVPYVWRARKHGFSRNRISQLIDQGLLGAISFSNVPMRLALFTGFALALLSFLYAIYVIGVRIFFPEIATRGVPTIIIAIFFFGGMNLLFLGMMGEYIISIFNQVRKRPIVIERERINF
ncbi:MAG: glycosyltransferase family 2 protein [Proteobacteria bacterium]|jgi:glycosyltransferase involved in cell wall biosynthesis|nr:glycosyltransferase family 2 protein [Pseudomonadota bacterium]